MTLQALTPDEQFPRSLLVIAHPGHELRLVNWLSRTRPDVMVLTDGSGGGGHPRIDATRRTVAASGARACRLFGSYTDRQIYQAMLSDSPALFVNMTCQLIAEIRLGGYRTIVRDPFEGYNPTHDLCALLVNVAAIVVRKRYRLRMRIFDFPLTGLSDFRQSDALKRCVLSETDQARKRAAAADYVELADEVAIAAEREGSTLFTEEVLRELADIGMSGVRHLTRPFYESYGEQQRIRGRYASVIRYAQHFAPIESALTGLMEPARMASDQAMLSRAEEMSARVGDPI